MADQLLGVLRELVAAEAGKPAPGASTIFSGEMRGTLDAPDWRSLPVLLVGAEDRAAGFLATVAASEPNELLSLIETAPERTVEVELRRARTLIELGRF